MGLSVDQQRRNMYTKVNLKTVSFCKLIRKHNDINTGLPDKTTVTSKA
jgi:hypothetical protein